MNTAIRKIYEKYASGMAYVAVEQPDGTESIGSAFHVGDGVFVTARHVVENNTILEISTVIRSYIPVSDESTDATTSIVLAGGESFQAHTISPTVLEIIKGPFFHRDEKIDIAVFLVSGLDPYTPAMPLGCHLDDWLGIDDLVLSEVLVLGFPPIPFAMAPTLIAARGEVNGLIDVRHSPHVHFVVSAMARGGFSGGVVLTRDDFILGVITQSLVMNNEPEQLGYMTVISVEPIYQCLADNKMLPRAQSAQWDGLWNGRTHWFAKDGVISFSRLSIDVFDDGYGLTLSLYSTVATDLITLIYQVKKCNQLLIVEESITSDRAVFEFQVAYGASQLFTELEESLILYVATLGYTDQNDYLLKNTPMAPF
ncbi:serine protease [Xanthomonas sp. WHRI 1810A]|uniref:S1 family peptidase n=1 Tax=Xanthomonas sp. WHRI 1810A TaxID=3161565 RepID=UPI0032E868E8